MTHHQQPAEDAQVLFPFPLTAYLHDGDLEPDPNRGWTEAELGFPPANVVVDAVIDGPRRRDVEELVYLLGGPFGVEWRPGQLPIPAPATSWEPTVLELGCAVAEAMHLDPLWGDDPADYAKEVRFMRGCGCLVTALVGLFLALVIAGSLLTGPS